jgi:DNA-binding NarL/FixJ family response regulator
MFAPMSHSRLDAQPPPAIRRHPVRVVLADPADNARRAIAAVIDDIDGVTLVGQVSSTRDLPAAIRNGRADMLVIDDRLLTGDRHPLTDTGPHVRPVRIIVLGIDDHPTFAARAMRLGAEAWIAKELADDTLRQALEV